MVGVCAKPGQPFLSGVVAIIVCIIILLFLLFLFLLFSLFVFMLFCPPDTYTLSEAQWIAREHICGGQI